MDKAKVGIKQNGAILVEGQVDVLSSHQVGLTQVVAPSGTALTLGQLKLLSRYTKDIIFCFDSDTAGSSAILRGIEMAEKEDFNIKVIAIPEKYKDLDEMLHKDLEGAKELVNDPIPVYDFFLISAVKKNDKTNAIGKKKIMQELVEKFSKVSNPVLLDHYTKKISEELDMHEETVKDLLSRKTVIEERTHQEEREENKPTYVMAKNSPQEYIIALLLKTPLDTAQTLLYKLGQKDFTNGSLQEVFTDLKEYLHGRKRKFEIEYYNKRLPEELQAYVNELYLWDLDEVTEDPERLEKELDGVFFRIKKETAKKELKELSEKIKQSEMEKDSKLTKELSEKFKELSQRYLI